MSDATIKRTNIKLDTELVDAAKSVLGTLRTTDTVHAALRDVVARAARERLARRSYAALTPTGLDRLCKIRQPA